MTDEPSKKPRSLGSANRVKGHSLERFLAQLFRDLGYARCLTTRQASRIMDDAKIDLYGIPFNIQSKSVEANINYQVLTQEIKAAILDKVPERIEYPIIIVHKKSNKGTNVVMDINEFIKLIKQIHVNPKI